ncbi:GNAT family N-acetyltransferase [Robertkochia solimangrovi]|uniref:GNAT family N-acetyltransferase n=1 Tax=Robertkochia solimangrovi TaxID=2213046 RepID=UPI00117D2BC4|nr:GNAT family N-acetyltransferase [Robertkochia solimangrovi]TRZ41871.1 N-acetyltransferase [Robertkochia solimangrovi]
MTRIEQEDNGRKGKFVIYVDDEHAGEMTYTRAGSSKFIIDHTEIDEKFSGNGYGNDLVMKGVEYARENDQKILPLCPFAKKVFDTTPEIADVRYGI